MNGLRMAPHAEHTGALHGWAVRIVAHALGGAAALALFAVPGIAQDVAIRGATVLTITNGTIEKDRKSVV